MWGIWEVMDYPAQVRAGQASLKEEGQLYWLLQNSQFIVTKYFHTIILSTRGMFPPSPADSLTHEGQPLSSLRRPWHLALCSDCL